MKWRVCGSARSRLGHMHRLVMGLLAVAFRWQADGWMARAMHASARHAMTHGLGLRPRLKRAQCRMFVHAGDGVHALGRCLSQRPEGLDRPFSIFVIRIS